MSCFATKKQKPEKTDFCCLVRVAGVEPVHLSAQEPNGNTTWMTRRKPSRIKGSRHFSF